MKSNSNNRIWLNRQEAADYIGVNVKTIDKYSRSGSNMGIRLPYSRLSGKLVRFNRHKIDKFLEAHEVKSQVNIAE